MRKGPYAARGPFKCRRCGVEYLTHRAPGEGEHYCSRKCNYEDKARLPAFCRVELTSCCVCAKRWIARPRRRFCSDECRAVHRHDEYIAAKQAMHTVKSSYVAPA